MTHVALLGDSIFDNGAYVGDGPEVVAHLREKLAPSWQASLLAIDGSMVVDIASQLERLPPDTTHIVVSIGGNDALDHTSIVERPAVTMADALADLAELHVTFGARHRAMLDVVKQVGLPTAICTIYGGNFEQPRAMLLGAALTTFNDAITRNVFAGGLDLIDLRLVCTEPGDYANPIEPSVQGGAKIAAAVARFLSEMPAGAPASRVFAG